MARITIQNVKTDRIVSIEEAAFTNHLKKQGWQLYEPAKFEPVELEIEKVVPEKKSVAVESEPINIEPTQTKVEPISTHEPVKKTRKPRTPKA
jgi:hypothetical protein